jgi:putative spermidine/putrescine transport system substrate-binding protein
MRVTSTAGRSALATLAAGMLIITACGSDKKESSATQPAATTTAAGAATTTAAGGGATTTAASGGATTTAASGGATTTAASGGAADLSALVDACKAEKKVNLIALPDSWANYKGILQAFRDKYPGVDNPVASPDISSQEELDAINNLKGQADMPDSIDVSPAKAHDAVTQGLLTPFKPSTYDEIPDALKDPDGNWVAAYYGIMAISTNTTIVKNAPKTFADLKKPEYKGKVALNGDPRKAGAAFAAVMAASLANGGSADDIMPGIQFFADLQKSGNLIPVQVTPQTVISGETPIAIDWSYNLPGLEKQLADAGLTVETDFPTDGVYGGYYAQGVVKSSPHQNCAKLWIEHIVSDEGALGYLQGGAMPARYETLVKENKISADQMKNLPPADLIAKIKFLTQDQVDKANALLQTNWGPRVSG